ncbi:MAG: AI-2E family transporter YdiK [Buchnera aphidicola (Periphyllus aceris)]|nr:AI-2E family transporter YdiK [Buchnera aphidicola (Periphyllus aceris)]
MKNPKNKMDLSQIIVMTVSIASIIIASFYIVYPFLKSLFWASMIVISTWPIFLKLENFLNRKRHLSIFLIILSLLLLFFFPIFLFLHSLIENGIIFINWITMGDYKLTNLYCFKNNFMYDTKLKLEHHTLLDQNSKYIIYFFKPYFYQLIKFFFSKINILIKFSVDLFFVVFFSYLLYWKGEIIKYIIDDLLFRLNSKLIGSSLTSIFGKSIRSVALGILLTAFFQGILAELGLLLIGIPYSIFIIIFIIFLSLIQIGSFPVLIPIVLWLYWKKFFVYGTFLLLWSFFLSILDSVMKFLFIKIGINLPVFLIVSGVLGGFISFGMIGLFVGPVILDITYRIVLSWIKKK